ncbi:MAG: hypothetical protein ABIJ45_04890 [Candidatus Zixiibacteriota bacterium]
MRKIFAQLPKLISLKKFWGCFYLFKAILAMIFTIPFFLTFNSVLSLSSLSKSLLKDWDSTVFIEMLRQSEGSIVPVLSIIFVGGLLYAIAVQFLNGGLYYLMVSGRTKEINWKEFYSECGCNFITHLKISAIMVIIYMILLPFGLFLANILGGFGDYLSGNLFMMVLLFKLLFIFLILTSASLFSDSLRCSVSAAPDIPLKESINKAAEFFRPRLLFLLKIFIITYLPFIIIWLLAEFLSLKINILMTGLFGISMEFIFLQISSLMRTGQKLWYLLVLGNEYRNFNPGRYLPEQTELNL